MYAARKRQNDKLINNDFERRTFIWIDFYAADKQGITAIKKTFQKAFEWWKNDYKCFTELMICLNYKIFEHLEKGNNKTANIYYNLRRAGKDYILENFNKKELDYYYTFTD